MNTQKINEENSKYIRLNLSKFIFRCSHCYSKSSSQNEPDGILKKKKICFNSGFFCIKCLTACCKFCIEKEHFNHPTSSIAEINLKEVKCPVHGISANLFCTEDLQFICSDCVIKHGHKRHEYLDFYEAESIEQLKEDFLRKFLKLKSSCTKRINSINKSIEELKLNSSIHSNMLLNQEFQDYEKAEILILKKHELSQSLIITETILDELSYMLTNEEIKIISIDTKHKKKSLEDFLNTYFVIASTPVNKRLNNQKRSATNNIKNSISNDSDNIENSSGLNDESNLILSSTLVENKLKEKENVCASFKNIKMNSNVNVKKNEQNKLTTNCSVSPNDPKTNGYVINNINKQFDEDLIFTDLEFKIGSSMKFLLIKVESPEKILIIPETRYKKLKKFYLELTLYLEKSESNFTEEELTNLNTDSLVLGFVNANYYTRMIIIEKKLDDLNELKFKLFGIDDGVLYTLKQVDLKKIPEIFKEIPRFTIECSLYNLKPYTNEQDMNLEWNERASVLIFEWSRHHKKTIYAKFIDIKDNLYQVDIYHKANLDLINSRFSSIAQSYNIGSVSLSETLIKFKSAMRKDENDTLNYLSQSLEKIKFIPMKPFYIDESFSAYICHFDSVNSFYLKRLYPDDEYDQAFYNLSQKINEYYKDSNELTIFDPEEGMPVAALYTDNKWYRAEIHKIEPNSTKFQVMFIDYGEICSVDQTRVRYLKKDYLYDQVSTFKCKLFGIEFKDKDSAFSYIYDLFSKTINSDSKIVNVHIKNVINDKDCKSLLESSTNEIILRCNLDGKMTNINVMLTKKGLAECTNLAIFDGEKESSKRNIKENHILKRTPMPTYLEKATKDLKDLPNMIINKKPENSVLCKVTNAISPNEIWVQDVIDANELYDNLQKSLYDKYSVLKKLESDFSILNEWKLNDLCVIKKARQDEFYRARIVEKLPNGKFKVICLDNGIYEITYSQYMYELIDEFKKKPAFMAKKCHLIGVQPTGTTNGKWSSLAENFTSETLNDNYVLIVFNFEKKSDDSYDVCIYVDAKQKNLLYLEQNLNSYEFVRFSDILNSKGLALLIEKKQSIEILLANRVKKSDELLENGVYKSYRYSDLPNKVNRNYQNNKYAEYDCLACFAEFNPDLNEYYVYVHFTNLMRTNLLLSEFKKEFETCYSENNSNKKFDLSFLIESVDEKKYQACVCKFESKFYRAELLDNIENNKFLVRLVDFGSVIEIEHNSIFRPMLKYINIERQAFRVKIVFKMDQDYSFDLNKLINNKLVKLKLDTILDSYENEDQKTIVGDLLIESYGMLASDYLKMRDSNELKTNTYLNPVKKINPIREISKFELPLYFNSVVLNVIITWIDNIDKIWIQISLDDIENDEDLIELNELKKSKDLFNKMQIELTQLLKNKTARNLKFEEILENKSCCCFYNLDNNLYRAVILSVDYLNQNAFVRYVDYGNQELVDFNEIYELDDIYKQIPEQAFCFKLKDVKINEVIKSNSFQKDKFLNDFHDSLLELPNDVNIYAKFFIKNEKENENEFELYFNQPRDDKSNLAYKKFIDKNLLIKIK